MFVTTILQILVQLISVPFELVILLLDVLGLGAKRLRPKKPKSILITGATSGIGENLAIHYAASGVTLALTGRNPEALARVTAACEGKGARVLFKQIDVSDKEGMARWIAEVDGKSPLDLVVANAGVTEDTVGLRSDLEAASYVVFDTNVNGVFNTLFPALPGMQKRGSGQLVIMSSLAGFGALSGAAAYSGSKAAVRVWGESLRLQLQRDGICVNVICPGYVESPMVKAATFNPTSIPMAQAIKEIVAGLERNEAVIAFPAVLAVQTWFMGLLPAQVKDWIAANRLVAQIGYWKKRKTGSKEAKQAKEAKEDKKAT
ncbi:hypothetical protein DFJ74DRAFT_688139 [Hyaloraphidium curvatum]|nr:hypothetical protein DFJ74DRAFT_688139 [Hyaloraphidium curvatum]